MARILITTEGSNGDLYPFLALAHGLRGRGHDVRFALADRFAPLVTGEGFAVDQLGNPGKLDRATKQAFFQGGSTTSTARMIVGFIRRALGDQRSLARIQAKLEVLCAACADQDLLVSSQSQPFASSVAELTGIAWASVALTPLGLPSDEYSPVPLPFSPPRVLQRAVNRLAWAIMQAMVRRMVDGPINKLRATYGLAKRQDLLLMGNLSHTLTAATISPAFLPRPADWPAYVHATGFCFWDKPSTWQAPAELGTFLDGSTPVVAISSGSRAPKIAAPFASFYHTSIAAVQRLGARALVIGAAPGVLPDPLPTDVFALPFAPFSEVYPRCAAVIHHGGIGTVAQALRAGVPMLVVPWGFDQFLLGTQVTRIGVGQWIKRPRYTVQRVAPMLEALLYDEGYRRRTQAIAAQIAQEDGVAMLCDELEAVIGCATTEQELVA